MTPSTAAAQALALQALTYLLAEPETGAAFLAQAGISAGDLRGRLEDPEFLSAVMDFLLTEDALILGFAAEAGVAPEAIPAARAHLPGGDLPHWT